MTYYRLLHLDLSTRFELALEMLNPSRPWGLVTLLSDIYGVSRKFLYELSHKAESSILKALDGQAPGRKPKTETLILDDNHKQRSIVTLATVIPASIRGIQTCMEELYKTHCSLGYISQTLQQAGEAAKKQNHLVVPKQPVLGEADEIFQGHHPCLTLVDGDSFAVLQLSPQTSRDAVSWGISFIEMQERGVDFLDLACDGAKGIRAGAKEAGLYVPIRPDLFHLTREASRLKNHLESLAYKAIEVAERARRSEIEANAGHHRRGPHLKVIKSVPESERQERESIERYDLFVWLCEEIRQSLEPFGAIRWTSEYILTSSTQSRQTLETAIELMKELGSVKVKEYAQDIERHIDELIAPLLWLEEQLSCFRVGLDSRMESTIIWSYKHRQELGIDDAREGCFEGFPLDIRPVVQAYWSALKLFHRSSSLAESLHSWLRPYFVMHRGIPEWLTPLLQIYWNHHTFRRGKRKGKNPLGDDTRWSEVLDILLKPDEGSKAA